MREFSEIEKYKEIIDNDNRDYNEKINQYSKLLNFIYKDIETITKKHLSLHPNKINEIYKKTENITLSSLKSCNELLSHITKELDKK